MLPQPDDGFLWVPLGAREALVCRALQPFAVHFFTTRRWRLGSAPPDRYDEAWADVAEAAEVEPDRLVRLQQVHGAAVVVVPGGPPRRASDLPQADIAVAAETHSALAIQTADCVPLLIADRRTGAVAAAHAGWRGMSARVPEAAVAALGRAFGSQPADLIAAIGPSVGACCYEVGPDVRDAFTAARFQEDELSRWFVDAPRPTMRNCSMAAIPAVRRPDHWYFDGWAAVRDQLESAGIPPPQVHAAGLCTASHADFCSYRRDGAAAGRMAAAIRSRRA
jgi:purine-nucleoside/S-methyl-5'-thioadenosine phosphorylase / adenosine deaminase